MALLESHPFDPPSSEAKLRTWELLARSETLDRFLQAKLGNVKRYGLEGAETMLPVLDTVFQQAASGEQFNPFIS